MSTSTVDIIIPCYNTGRYLRQAIDSALAQTYPHINVLVVDDGSTDDTREIVESYGGRVGYFYQENKGLPAARNAGILRTHGEFVCVLDADDVMLPHRLEAQSAFLRTQPAVDLVHTKVLAFRSDDLSDPVAETYRPHMAWNNYLEPLCLVCAICASSVMMRRRTFERAGLFPEDMIPFGEDWIFWWQCIFSKVEIAYLPAVHTLYRHHPGSLSAHRAETLRCDTEVFKRVATMFDAYGVTEKRKRKILSCGIMSVAIRWLEFNQEEEFENLLNLSRDVLADDTDYGLQQFRELAATCPIPILNLWLSKELLEMGIPELAAAFFLRCGYIRTLHNQAIECNQMEMFDYVTHSMENFLAKQQGSQVRRGGGVLRARPSPCDTKRIYVELERVVPSDASITDYVKHQLGILEQIRGHTLKAEQYFRDSIFLNPNFSYAHFDLGIVLQTNGDFEVAEKELRTSIDLNPDFSFAHYDLGRLLEARGDYKGAEEALRTSIKLNPEFSWAHFHLGRILETGRDYVGAEEEFRSCLAIDPGFALCRLDHAKVLAKTGRYGKAAAEFLKASRTDPRASSNYLMGWLKSVLGKRLGRDLPKLNDSQ